MKGLQQHLNCPVDAASLAVFRILFGLLMAFAMVRFQANGWVDEFYVKPTFFFSYEWFPWVRPLPPVAMHALFVLLAGLAFCVAAGFCYRASMGLFFLGFTYVELIDKTTYLNHYYLVTLLSGLMIFLPAHRLGSIDAWLRPILRGDLAPAWTIHILRFQIAVVYLFAGLAKLNAEWLFDAQPLRIWLAARSDLPVIGPLLTEAWVAYAASWVGAAYDLTIVFLLMHRRSRPWAFTAVVVFHLVTWILFRIGIFPWLMIVSALLFFPPGWPRQLLQRLGGGRLARRVVDCGGMTPLWRHGEHAGSDTASWCVGKAKSCLRHPKITGVNPALLTGLILYAATQLVLPLRHYFQADSSAWTGKGFNWSWRVMLVEKSGYAEFRAVDPGTGRQWRIRATEYLTARQAHFMAQDPAMIQALARHIATDLRTRGHPLVQLFTDSHASLNGRPSQRLIDPTIDFGSIPGTRTTTPTTPTTPLALRRP